MNINYVSEEFLIESESKEEFQKLLDDLTAYYEPKDVRQKQLVATIAINNWRLTRIYKLESEAIENERKLQGQMGSKAALGETSIDAISKLAKYEASLKETTQKAHNELLEGKKQL